MTSPIEIQPGPHLTEPEITASMRLSKDWRDRASESGFDSSGRASASSPQGTIRIRSSRLSPVSSRPSSLSRTGTPRPRATIPR